MGSDHRGAMRTLHPVHISTSNTPTKVCAGYQATTSHQRRDALAGQVSDPQCSNNSASDACSSEATLREKLIKDQAVDKIAAEPCLSYAKTFLCDLKVALCFAPGDEKRARGMNDLLTR